MPRMHMRLPREL